MLAFLGHSGRRTGLKSPVRNLKLNTQKCKNNHMLVWRNGRRTGLKILRGQLRVGSSPTTSTKLFRFIRKKSQQTLTFLFFKFFLQLPKHAIQLCEDCQLLMHLQQCVHVLIFLQVGQDYIQLQILCCRP